MKPSVARNVDEYISEASSPAQPLLKEMRQIIRENAPEAEESIRYQMPAYKHLGRPLVYFGGFKHHVSLFAAGSQGVAETFKNELKDHIQSKGTIQFPLDQPLPKDLIAKIVQYRVRENEAKHANR